MRTGATELKTAETIIETPAVLPQAANRVPVHTKATSVAQHVAEASAATLPHWDRSGRYHRRLKGGELLPLSTILIQSSAARRRFARHRSPALRRASEVTTFRRGSNRCYTVTAVMQHARGPSSFFASLSMHAPASTSHSRWTCRGSARHLRVALLCTFPATLSRRPYV